MVKKPKKAPMKSRKALLEDMRNTTSLMEGYKRSNDTLREQAHRDQGAMSSMRNQLDRAKTMIDDLRADIRWHRTLIQQLSSTIEAHARGR